MAVVGAIQAAGPSFKPARYETLSNHCEPQGASRPGGLYLAQQSTHRERRIVFRKVQMAPSAEALDPFNEASDALIKAVVMLRFEDYGWCRGFIVRKNTDRRRKMKGVLVNFIAQFDIDDQPTDLALDAMDYDPSGDADYESWLLLEAEAEVEAEAEAEAEAVMEAEGGAEA